MKNYRHLFPYLELNPKEIYFDSAATNLKLETVINAESEYLKKISANPHSTSYKNGYESSKILDKSRLMVKEFINAKNIEEVIFTSGATHSLNQIAFGLKNILDKDSEILTTNLEHSSNLMPWIILSKEIGFKIKFVELDDDGKINLKSLKKNINKNTKVFSFANMSNTLAVCNDVKQIIQTIRKINKNVITIVDAAQSAAHKEIDVQNWDVDLIAFAAHKIYGPFGVGVLWGKKEILKNMTPLFYGGGNVIALNDLELKIASLPSRLECGTPNISSIYALQKVFEFIKKEGLNSLIEHEKNLKKYIVDKIKEQPIKHVEFYNLDNEEPILLFNVIGANPQDIGTFFEKRYNISIRTGSHCARRTDKVFGASISSRASFSIFNTIEEVEILYKALVDSNNWMEEII